MNIPPLQPHDRVLILSTARKVSFEEVAPAVEILKSWNLQVELGLTIGAEFNQFAGPDELRLQDLQQALDRPDIKAVICARGGYGTARLLDSLDLSGFAHSPKWVVGFSDVTALHCHLNRLGYETIHGIMPLLFSREGSEEAIATLRRALFGEPLQYHTAPHPFNRPGQAQGQLVGGNLSILHTIIGTRSDIDTTGKILFLEDLDEYLYHIDRMLVHLDRCNKLAPLAGLVVGQMSDMKDNAIPFGKDAYEIILEHAGNYGYPVCFGFPTGHEARNLALICNRNVQLNVQENEVSLVYC